MIIVYYIIMIKLKFTLTLVSSHPGVYATNEIVIFLNCFILFFVLVKGHVYIST